MTEFTFAYPWVLLGLVAVPLLAALRFVPRFRRRRRGTFLLSTTNRFRDLPRGFRQYLRPIADALLLVALVLLIVALARPQTVEGNQLEVEGIDIYLALDMSGSMKAIDASEEEIRRLQANGERPDNRFDEAVDTLKEFIESRKHDRIGMTVFAQEAFLQFPLTLDYRTILGMLDRLELGDIETGGTVIGNALGRAVSGLKESDASTKIVVLITDGARRGGNISPTHAAKLAAQYDIKVFPILVGQEGPTYIPVETHGLFGGSSQTQYRARDFPVDPGLLKTIAEKTGGAFYRASDAEKIRTRLHEILDKFDRSQLESSASVDRTEHYVSFLLWAVALLGVQFVARYTLLRAFP